MSVFSHREFDQHEQVAFFCEPAAGLKAIIAIHNTNRGPALGGCRMWPYASDEEALRDALRLARGMTYKSAVANLGIGGGKTVIIGDPRTGKTEALLRAAGRAIDRMGGRYIAAEDSGTSVADMKVMAQETPHVSGIRESADPRGRHPQRRSLPGDRLRHLRRHPRRGPAPARPARPRRAEGGDPGHRQRRLPAGGNAAQGGGEAVGLGHP